MTAHIEWLVANHTQVAGIAEPHEFENDGSDNDVACIVIVSQFGDSDGVCIEGPPDDLVALAHRILNAANAVKSDTNVSPKLRRLYGIIDPLEPSTIHEEMGRQVLDDQHFEPEYHDGGM